MLLPLYRVQLCNPVQLKQASASSCSRIRHAACMHRSGSVAVTKRFKILSCSNCMRQVHRRKLTMNPLQCTAERRDCLEAPRLRSVSKLDMPIFPRIERSQLACTSASSVNACINCVPVEVLRCVEFEKMTRVSLLWLLLRSLARASIIRLAWCA